MQVAAATGVAVPVLETERLRMRAHRADDFDLACAMWSEPVVIRHTSGTPQPGEEVWKRMLRYGGLWSMLGYGYWAVEDKATGAFIGEVGFADFKREMTPSLDGMPEVGWVLAPHTHGKGFATEAVRAALAWGDQRFGTAMTCCMIHPENAASIRVAGKCGYREWQRAKYKEHDVIVYRRDAAK